MQLNEYQELANNLIIHLKRSGHDVRKLVNENIATIKLRKPTAEFQLRFFDICVHLSACLDYLAEAIQNTWCDTTKVNPYFVCTKGSDPEDIVDKKLNATFPGLHHKMPQIYQLLKENQPSMGKDVKILDDLREQNNRGKHIKLLPPSSFDLLKGTTIYRRSGSPKQGPFWIWANNAIIGDNAEISGGNGSILGVNSLECSSSAIIFGVRGEALLKGDTGNDVEILPFLCLWYAEGLSLSVLQFVGHSLMVVTRIVHSFLVQVALSQSYEKELNQLFVETPMLNFGQIYVANKLEINGRIVSSNWE